MSGKQPLPKAPRVPVPLTGLEQHLEDQLRFLRKSAAEFDAGDTAEFRRMAVTIRVLVHDFRTSHSLLGQLNLTSIPFASTASPTNPRNLATEFSLALIRISPSGAHLVAHLGDGPRKPAIFP
jgi:hypothetical protein